MTLCGTVSLLSPFSSPSAAGGGDVTGKLKLFSLLAGGACFFAFPCGVSALWSCVVVVVVGGGVDVGDDTCFLPFFVRSLFSALVVKAGSFSLLFLLAGDGCGGGDGDPSFHPVSVKSLFCVLVGKQEGSFSFVFLVVLDVGVVFSLLDALFFLFLGEDSTCEPPFSSSNLNDTADDDDDDGSFISFTDMTPPSPSALGDLTDTSAYIFLLGDVILSFSSLADVLLSMSALGELTESWRSSPTDVTTRLSLLSRDDGGEVVEVVLCKLYPTFPFVF